jgi:hypothetical protein
MEFLSGISQYYLWMGSADGGKWAVLSLARAHQYDLWRIIGYKAIHLLSGWFAHLILFKSNR